MTEPDLISVTEWSLRLCELDGSPVVSPEATGLDETLGPIITTTTDYGPIEVEVHAHASRPPVEALADRWDQSYETSVECSSGLLLSDLESSSDVVLVRTGGRYRLRISSSLLTSDAESEAVGDGAETASEALRFDVWPQALSADVMVRERAEPSVLPLRYAREGVAAGERIGVDLDGRPGSRSMTGELGAATAEYEYAATRRKMFTPFKLLFWFTASSRCGGEPDAEGHGDLIVLDRHFCWDERFYDPFLGKDEHVVIRARRLNTERPKLVEFDWRWVHVAPVNDVPLRADEQLTSVSQVTITLTERKDDTGAVFTMVRVTHAGLPVEWVKDLAAVWRWRMESIADRFERPHDA